MKGNPLKRALTLLTNIRLGWKGLPRTNTLPCLLSSLMMNIKKFYNIDTRLKIYWKCLRLGHWEPPIPEVFFSIMSLLLILLLSMLFSCANVVFDAYVGFSSVVFMNAMQLDQFFHS
jgi:hypothetical protein